MTLQGSDFAVWRIRATCLTATSVMGRRHDLRVAYIKEPALQSLDFNFSLLPSCGSPLFSCSRCQLRPLGYVAPIYLPCSCSCWIPQFGNDKEDYANWNKKQLKDWLNDRNIHAPSGYDKSELQELVKANWDDATTWTQDQYNQAQKTFQDVKQSSFDTWDESRLRQFLLEQGVVAPSSKKEELVLLANKQYVFRSQPSRC